MTTTSVDHSDRARNGIVHDAEHAHSLRLIRDSHIYNGELVARIYIRDDMAPFLQCQHGTDFPICLGGHGRRRYA